MKLRVGFVTTRNIHAIACLERYKEIFQDWVMDIIYWDRLGLEEYVDKVKLFRYKQPLSRRTTKLGKLLGYLRFRSFAMKLMKSEAYDLFVILPGSIGLLFGRYLKKRYRNRYILDIRDYTAENNPLFFALERALIRGAGLVIITSPAYRTFLPDHEYLISHNVARVDQEAVDKYRCSGVQRRKRIVISCIGGIRFVEQFKRVISRFANDERYELRFIGRGSESLREFANVLGTKNVVLEGIFDSKDTVNHYMDTNIVMNLYGNNNPLLDYALSNKLYYAARLGIPILVCPGTYMEKTAVENGFGFSFDLDDDSGPNDLYEYYRKIDWPAFFRRCDDFIRNVSSDENEFRMRMRDFLESCKEKL